MLENRLENKLQPEVSVVLLTYNHEEYIRQCLDSILMQKTNFSYEVVVGDDCSQDSTQAILKEYNDKYPGFFNMILREQNIGATNNLYDVLNKCRGKYLAGIEGDDYWIDENKLQIQFDFLERHQEYIGCSHPARVIDEIGQERHWGKRYFDTCHWAYYKPIYTFDDFCRFEKPGQASTWFYRNIYISPQYDYSIIKTANSLIADTTVMLILSSQGNWYYMMDKVMTCYRFISKPNKGSWASGSRHNNVSYENFSLYNNLEEYSRDVLGKNLDLRVQKFNSFHHAFNVWRHTKDKEKKLENKEVLRNIWKLARPKGYYIRREFKIQIKARINSKLYLSTVKEGVVRGELETQNDILLNSNWKNFKTECKKKTLVIFGGGAATRQFLRKYGKNYCVPIVLDNDKRAEDKPFYYDKCKYEYDFMIIKHPTEVLKWDTDKFVVLITSSIYQDEMACQLESMGFYNYFSFGIMESKRVRYKLLKKSDKANAIKIL